MRQSRRPPQARMSEPIFPPTPSLSSAEVVALLAQPESEQVAWLRERSKPDEIAETLVAFANAHGGTLLIGVAGGRSRPRIEGVQDVATLREVVLEAMQACTPPLVLPLPAPVTVPAGADAIATVLVVQVPPGLPQVYSLHGKYLRRAAYANQPLAPDALRRLLNERGEVSWERLSPDDATLAELDPQRITAYLTRLGLETDPDPMAMLYRRGCVSRIPDVPDTAPPAQRLRPTNAGLLLFGREVSRRYPHAELTLVQYRGTELADEFERDDIQDTLPDAIRRAERWLLEHMRRGSRMVGLVREDWVQFPPPVVREALVNAVAHRDYSMRGEGIRIALFADRLECYSPGRLPGHVTLDNLVQERFSRNETLVQVLADLGLIERLGYGIDRMFAQMAAAGLPEPVFRETAAGFLVTLYGQPATTDPQTGIDTSAWVQQGLNERQIAALLFLQQQHRITNRDLQELAPDVSAETIRRDLADLVERGLLLKVGERRATYYILK